MIYTWHTCSSLILRTGAFLPIRVTSEHYEDLTRPEHPLSVLAELAQLDLIKNMSVHEKGLEPHGFQRDSKEFKINEEWLESNAWNSFVKI